MKSDVEETLRQRNSVHGNFDSNARCSQDIKRIINEHLGMRVRREGTLPLNDVQLEALDLIATKISRIVSGNANHTDHWHDIQGYAALAEKTCNPVNGR